MSPSSYQQEKNRVQDLPISLSLGKKSSSTWLSIFYWTWLKMSVLRWKWWIEGSSGISREWSKGEIQKETFWMSYNCWHSHSWRNCQSSMRTKPKWYECVGAGGWHFLWEWNEWRNEWVLSSNVFSMSWILSTKWYQWCQKAMKMLLLQRYDSCIIYPLILTWEHK